MTAPYLGELRKSLLAALHQSAWTDAYQLYLSKTDINNLTSREYILSIVEEDQTIEPTQKREFSDYVYKNARILFAMFVYYGIPMTHLQTVSYTDDNLPIPTTHILDTRVRQNIPLEFRLHILGGQWMFLAPQFSSGGSHQKLDPNAILPFRSMVTVSAGTFSSVYKVEIEPGHFNHVSIQFQSPFSSNSLSRDIAQAVEQPLALKVITRRNETDGMNERKILEGLRSVGHPNVIELLTSFERERELGMFFPLATCDLDQYMRLERPLVDDQYVSWLLTQLRGLTDALSKIHEYNLDSTIPQRSNGAYHRDLKPQNILFFQDSAMPKLQGVFKISDFGIAKFPSNERTASSNPNATRAITGRVGTRLYAPPAVELKDTPSSVNDMWSFGCIILELLIWMRYGPGERADFIISVNEFFRKDHHGNFDVHDKVGRAIQRLRHSKYDAVLHEILETVVNGLLIWSPQDRWTSTRLLSHLNTIAGEENSAPNPGSHLSSPSEYFQ